MFWHIIPRSVIVIADLRVLPSRALLRNSFLFISVLGLLFSHFLQVASKSNGFKEPQPSGTFMSHKPREGSVIVGNQMTRGSRGQVESWASQWTQDTWLLGPCHFMTVTKFALPLAIDFCHFYKEELYQAGSQLSRS